MRGISFLPSCFRPIRESRATGAGKERVEPQPVKPVKPPSKTELPLPGPGLQRAETNPTRLPSNRPERLHIEPARPPITRAMPVPKPPKHFGRFLGIPLPFRTKAGSTQKFNHLNISSVTYRNLEPHVKSNPELLKLIKERHPDFDNYNQRRQAIALKAIEEHPAYRAIMAKVQNETCRIPTGPTATRTMTPSEQKFLTNAFHQISEDTRKNPFHIHGETAITGTKDGKITQFNHTSGLDSHAQPVKGDKYHLHSHPPFMEPATSSASVQDHQAAARYYFRDNNRTLSYVTNGKDVLHIQPDSTELVKLKPDPKLEKKLGKFPEAFRVPDPQERPYPFANHEAPPTFRKWDRER